MKKPWPVPYCPMCFPPPRYAVVPVQPDGDDQAQASPKHHIYRHQTHWLLRSEHHHRHAHEHPEYVHREIYRQGRGDRGED